MKLVDTDNSGHISYDEFISKMDIHLQKKTQIAGEQAQSIVFHKIKSLLDNHPDNLYEIMSSYDYENSGTIMVHDLVRAFKKLGMLHPEPHMEMLLEAGGARLQDERIDYVVFS
jgi:Ca2+-binding EF-hand superfamily protein